VQQFLAEKSIPVITQLLFSPNLSLSYFLLFPTVKVGLKKMRFPTMDDIKSNEKAELQKISNEAFHRCFQQMQDQWSMCGCARKVPTLNGCRYVLPLLCCTTFPGIS
jgi:hypothetical protein